MPACSSPSLSPSKPYALFPASQIARDGLDHMHNRFEFIRDGKTTTLAEAMQLYGGSYYTMEIQGSGPRQDEYVVPYRRKPYPKKSPLEELRGDALKRQLNAWADKGTIEPR